jgi:hypothetical protein
MSSQVRRFKSGEQFQHDGIWYRLVPGRKGRGDLRLEWASAGFPWRPVTLDHVAIIVDAIADNENVLYPPPAAGGGYVWKFLRQVLREGWRPAVHDLQLQRDRKNHPELFEDGSDAA